MSEIRATTISDAAGTGPITLTAQAAAKAWCNWNGQGTVAIRDSLNVSTLTDSGTGHYITSWSTNFGDLDYSVAVATGSETAAQNVWDRILGIREIRANGCTWYASNNDSDALVDPPVCSCTHNGDLA